MRDGRRLRKRGIATKEEAARIRDWMLGQWQIGNWPLAEGWQEKIEY